jgi:peptidyl-Lys metalloendopeptidase
MTGTDSKSGTIIHELSHFNIIAGTRDNVYSQNACRQLAIDNPSVAITTADNHEYFAENTPQLPN